MKYLLLVSHGGFAEGLKTSLAMFAGDKINQVIALGLENGQTVDEFAVRVKSVIGHYQSEDTFVVLADIVGGSPLTTVCDVLSEEEKLDSAVILGGMNLPMALTSLVMKDTLDGDDFVQAVLPEAQAALQEFKVASDVADDEDDI